MPRHTNYTNGLGFVDGPRGVAALLDMWGRSWAGPERGSEILCVLTHGMGSTPPHHHIQHLADQLHIEGVITDDIRQFAIRRNTKPARFYLLPKIHKKGVPGRPVVSACGSATEGMSEIVDFFLQPYMPTIPSFIKDTDDFIRRIRNIIDLLSDVLLVAFDVASAHLKTFY